MAGGGISAFAGSADNIKWFLSHRKFRTIGPDKLNQLRHVMKFPRGLPDVLEHMKKQAAIIKPKFDAVTRILQQELNGIASWTVPEGGYFISLTVPDGCAKKTIELAAQAGVKLTPDGSCFPYMEDPSDNNIRIAPTFPTLEDVEVAIHALCVCVRCAA